MGLHWVPGHAEVQGNENTDKLARDISLQKFVGPELSLGGLSAEHKKKDKTGG